MDPTWIVRLDAPGDGPRLAVKDCIDVEGLPTTAGCQVVAEQASPAAAAAPGGGAGRRGAGGGGAPGGRAGPGGGGGPTGRGANRRQDQPHRAVLVGQRGELVVRHAGEPAGSGTAARRVGARVGGGP